MIDYVIGEAGLRDRIERLEVEEKIDSDHHLVVVWVKKEKEKIGKEKDRRSEVEVKKYMWTEEEEQEWREKIQKVKMEKKREWRRNGKI